MAANQRKTRKRVRKTFYVGLVEGKIHFFRDANYYDRVRRADLFASWREAKKCYEDVVRVTVERVIKQEGE